MPFLPGDVLKAVVAALVIKQVHRSYPGLIPGPAPLRTCAAGGEGVPLTDPVAPPAFRLPGGSAVPRDRAISLDGRAWSYQQLEDSDAGRSARPSHRSDIAGRGPLVATGLPIDRALATVFAAAAAGVPVIVGDPLAPPPSLGSVPAETFLVAVTSGTSGRARAVLRTAQSWTSSFAPLAGLTGIGPADRVLLTGPLHATLHLFAAVHTLALGAELTDRPEDATAVHAVPAVLADLLDRLPGNRALRTAVVAGAALPAVIADRARARGIAVTEYYGAAELSFVAARRVPEPLQPFPGAQVDLRNGTLWVRSPVPRARLPDRARPVRSCRDDDGFATVGDLAEPDRGRRPADPRSRRCCDHHRRRDRRRRGRRGGAGRAPRGGRRRRGRASRIRGLGQVVTAVIEPAPDADLQGLRSSGPRGTP